MPKLTAPPRTPPKPIPPYYVSLREGAEVYGVHAKTLRRWIAEGKVPGYRIGGQIRVKLSDLDALVEQV
jgi:excisionase family DNA binding protein